MKSERRRKSAAPDPTYTTLPVIGVPLASGTLAEQDALLSTVQMPRGIPVASVGVEDRDLAGSLEALREAGRTDLREATDRVRAELGGKAT